MNISPVNNNQTAFAGKAKQNDKAKKPNKLLTAAGVASLAGVAVLGVGLASGKIKPADVATFAQKAGNGLLNTVKHPVTTVKNLPNKLLNGVDAAVGGCIKAAYALRDAKDVAVGYAKAVGGAIAETFSRK